MINLRSSGAVVSVLVFFFYATQSPVGAEQPATVVYEHDFDQPIDPKIWWSNRPTGSVKTPSGAGILTPLQGYTQLQFKHGGLPKHEFLRVRFKLAIIGSHDGVTPPDGPDNISLSVAGGARLFLTNFCNSKQGSQSFPDEFPAGHHKGRTGAAAIDTLGYASDALYDIEVVFPHTGKDVGLKFMAGIRKFGNDESWTLESFELATIAGSEKRTKAEFEALIEKVAGEDPIAANKAVWDLVASGSEAIPFLVAAKKILVGDKGRRLKALEAEIDKHLPNLEKEAFVDRMQARQALSKLHVDAIPLLEKRLKENADKVATSSTLKAIIKKIKVAAVAPGGKHQANRLIVSRLAHALLILETAESGRKIEVSSGWAPTASIDDGFVPLEMDGHDAPRFTWESRPNRDEWMVYSYAKPRTFDSVEVFWYQDLVYDKGARLPSSWRLLYDDGGTWKPVKNHGKYVTSAGEFNRVTFDPVTTSAFRLEIQETKGYVAGIFEFRLGQVAPKKPKPKSD